MKKYKAPACILILAVLTMSFIYQNGWFLFETDRYKIFFPKKPTDRTQTVDTELGKAKLNVYSYDPPESEPDDNYTYVVIETDYPDSLKVSEKKELSDKLFRNSVDRSVRQFNGKLLTESNIQLNNFPGREFRISLDNGAAVMTTRVYLVRNTMYLLQVIADAKKDPNPSIGKFMGSFSLKR